jgi:hypothetical protein
MRSTSDLRLLLLLAVLAAGAALVAAAAGDDVDRPAIDALVVGDSLTVAARRWLPEAGEDAGVGFVLVDARIGRPVEEGLERLVDLRASRADVVLVALGTNNIEATEEEVKGWVRDARAIVRQRRVIWVNLHLDPTSAPRLARYTDINRWLAEAAAQYGVELADWAAYAEEHDIRTLIDGVHYGDAESEQRAEFYAEVIAAR